MKGATLLGSRPGEGRLLSLVAATFALIEGARGMGEVGADTLVTSGPQGADVLPALFIVLGIVGMVATLGYAAALTRARGDRFFPGLVLVLAVALAAAWAVASAAGTGAASGLWVVVMAVGGLLMTVSWTVAARAFDARQARRLFPLCASAAIAGSFVGQLVSGPVAHLVGAPQLVLAESVLLLAAAAVLFRVGPPLRAGGAGGAVDGSPGGSLVRTLAHGAAFVARSPLLRLVAVAYVLFAVLLVGVSYGFLREARAAFPDEAQRATALGLFSAAVTATAFLVSALLANRITARIGVTATALTLPLVYLAGFLVWAVQLTFATAAAVRAAQVVTQRGVSNAAWSSFFSVVPGPRRAQVMAFIDGVPGQLGTILTGALLLVGLSGGRELFLAAAVIAAVCLGVVVLIRQAYVRTLVSTLRDGVVVRVLTRGPELPRLVADPAVLDGLIAGLDAAEPGRRRIVAGLLGLAAADPRAIAALQGLALDPDPGVRAAALDTLGGAGAGSEQALAALDDSETVVRIAALTLLRAHPAMLDAIPDAALDTLRADAVPGVRASLALALGGSTRRDAATRLVDALLTDEAPDARAAATRILGIDPDLVSDGPARLLGLLDDPAGSVRAAAAMALLQRPDGPASLVSAVIDGTAGARAAALDALTTGPDLTPIDRQRLLAWATTTLDRARSLAATAVALTSAVAAPTASAHAPPTDPGPVPDPRALAGLVRVLHVRRRAATEDLVAALRALGPPEVGAVIARSLRSADPGTRAQAIEGLEVVVGGPVARRVAALLDEAAPVAASGDLVAVLTELVDDRDVWVRTLAVHTLASVDRIERADAGGGATQMATIGAGASDLVDRVLLLGRVPLFSALSPEDLAGIAGTATSASFGADEVLIAEGDAGDHLVVIAEGTVRVVTGSPLDGPVVRRCGPGEHIGELAMLRRAPRAAFVVADPPGVRVLLLDADGLRAVLRERPDAAMAMLATLAERIGSSGG